MLCNENNNLNDNANGVLRLAPRVISFTYGPAYAADKILW